MSKHVLQTGQEACYDEKGEVVTCDGSGQDAESTPGLQWPEPRFNLRGEIVEDRLTGLIWLKNANPFTFPQTWQEALVTVQQMNREGVADRSDWRLPNRREMRSLICHGTRKPALPKEHPFEDVFLGWYWTSTTSALSPNYAWYVHLEGGRMFYGQKNDEYLVWPVCGISDVLPATGQARQYHEPIDSGTDGQLQMGAVWPQPRFQVQKGEVLDRLTDLVWLPEGVLGEPYMNWQQGLDRIARLRSESGKPWRMPTINELESLVDADQHSPALPASHPFTNTQEAYWSATTSYFEPDWSYVLYLHKGAVGVGFKRNQDFALWPVYEQRL